VVSGPRRARRDAYQLAAAERRAALARRLREESADLVWLDTAGNPLRPLVRFFRARATQRRGGS
jgi:hypothetical protein